MESQPLNGMSAEIERLDAGLAKIMDGLSAEEFAADFVVRLTLFFDQHDFAAGGSKAHGDHRPGQAAADYEILYRLVSRHRSGFFRPTQRRAGVNPSITISFSRSPAAAHMFRQSSGTNARAKETGPSC